MLGAYTYRQSHCQTGIFRPETGIPSLLSTQRRLIFLKNRPLQLDSSFFMPIIVDRRQKIGSAAGALKVQQPVLKMYSARVLKAYGGQCV